MIQTVKGKKTYNALGGRAQFTAETRNGRLYIITSSGKEYQVTESLVKAVANRYKESLPDKKHNASNYGYPAWPNCPNFILSPYVARLIMITEPKSECDAVLAGLTRGRSPKKMKPDDFIRTMQYRTGVTAVGPSALRGQGKGVLRATQIFLGRINLTRLSVSTKEEYADWLNKETNALLDNLPIKNRPWGAARKAINLFMRDALYNQYLNDHFGLGKLEQWMEVPLDRAVAKGLKKHDGHLPQWPGLKHLTPSISSQFQDFAAIHADRKKIERVHLDIYLWLENR